MQHEIIGIAGQRDNLALVSGVLNDSICAALFRSSNRKLIDHCIVSSLELTAVAEAVEDLAAVLGVFCLADADILLIDRRKKIISIAHLGRVILTAVLDDCREVDEHLKAGDLLIVLNSPLNGDLLTRSCIIRIVADSVVSDLGVILALRDEVIDDRISRNSLLLGRGRFVCRCIADYDVDAMQHEAERIADERDDLALVSGILNDRICAVLFRCSNRELIDHCIVRSLEFTAVAEAVEDLSAVLRVLSLGDIHAVLVDSRQKIVGIAQFGTVVLTAVVNDTGEVEEHLKAGDLLIVLNSPLNGDFLTRSCLVNIVAGNIISNAGIILALRDQVIDDRIARNGLLLLRGRFLCRRIVRHIADLNLKAAECILILITGERDDLALVSCIANDNIGAVLCRSLNIELIDHSTVSSLELTAVTEAVEDLTAVLRVLSLGGIHTLLIHRRQEIVSIAHLRTGVLTAVVDDIGEVEEHLKAGDLLVVLDCPLNSDIFAGGCLIDIVAGLTCRCCGVILALRDEIINDRAGGNRIARILLLDGCRLRRIVRLGCGCYLRSISDLNSKAVHCVRELVSDERNDLALVSRVPDDRIITFLGRRLNCKLIDNSTVSGLELAIVAKAVEYLTAVLGIVSLADVHAVLIDRRQEIVSIAQFRADILTAVAGDIREIKEHLKAGDLLIVLYSPLDRKGFARLSRILVIAAAGRRRIILPLRDQVIYDVAVSFDFCSRCSHRYRSKRSEH